MNKMLTLAAASLALSAIAAPQKLLEVTVADRNGLIEQATKLGELTGVPMIGIGAAGALGANPFAEQFGAMRNGANATLFVVADPEAIGDSFESMEVFAKTARVVALYPASVKKADFLAKHTELKEENGVIKQKKGAFFAYSADDQWVALGNDAAGVKKALGAAGKAKLAHGEAIRARVTEAGLATGLKLVTLSEKNADKLPEDLPANALESMKCTRQLLDQVKDIALSLRVSEKGVDIAYDLAAKPGTELAKVGEKKITAADPLAFAGKDALIANACAADSAATYNAQQYVTLYELLKKKGFKFDFITLEKKSETVGTYTLDVKALVTYVMGEGAATVAALENDKDFVKELEAAATKSAPFTAAGPEGACAIAIKNVTMAKSPSERFAAAFPELKGKPLVSAGVMSLYAMLKKGAIEVIDNVPGFEEAEMVKGMIGALPADTDGSVAIATLKRKDRLVMLARITPAEMKGFAAIVQVAVTSVGGMITGPALDGEELGDDED